MSRTPIPAPMSTPNIPAANSDLWDASTIHHEQSQQRSKLASELTEKTYAVLDYILTDRLILAVVNNAKLVQVGFNNGREPLSTFALGAQSGLGLSQSVEFSQQAKTLQAISGHSYQFLCSDVYALPNDNAQGFDIGLITIGVLS